MREFAVAESSPNQDRVYAAVEVGGVLISDDSMVERFVQVDDKLFAILSNGELWIKPLNQAKWQHLISEIGRVKALAAGG